MTCRDREEADRLPLTQKQVVRIVIALYHQTVSFSFQDCFLFALMDSKLPQDIMLSDYELIVETIFMLFSPVKANKQVYQKGRWKRDNG